YNRLFNWALTDSIDGWEFPDSSIISAFDEVQKSESVKDVVRLIRQYNLPREAIPTHWLNSVEVWEALLEKMPMTALIRNLAKMSSLNMFSSFSNNTVEVVNKLTSRDAIAKSRIHPIQVLTAMAAYSQGNTRSTRSKLVYNPNGRIIDALTKMFHLSFDHIEPINQNVLVALDC